MDSANMWTTCGFTSRWRDVDSNDTGWDSPPAPSPEEHVPEIRARGVHAKALRIRGKNGKRSQTAQKTSQNVPICGFVFHDSNGQNHGLTLNIQWYLLDEICAVTHSQASCGKHSSKKFFWSLEVKKSRIGNVFLFIENQDLFNGVRRWHGKKQNMVSMWKKWMKNVDFDEPTSFLDHVILGCAQRECKINEIIIEEFRKMFESRISAGATEKMSGWEKLHAKTVVLSCDMESHAQKCVKRYCELENKKTAVVQGLRSQHGWS